MNQPVGAEYNLVFSDEHLKPALLISLLSVWLLVGVFYYLNTYTRRRYFTIWTTAWLFYALWLTLFFCGQATGGGTFWQMWLKELCLCVSAVFLLWGSLRFLGQRVKQRLIALCLAFLALWSYADSLYSGTARAQIHWSVFIFIGLASLITAAAFYRYRKMRQFLGAALLTIGFFLWGAYLGAYPLFETPALAAAGFLGKIAEQGLVHRGALPAPLSTSQRGDCHCRPIRSAHSGIEPRRRGPAGHQCPPGHQPIPDLLLSDQDQPGASAAIGPSMV